MLLDEMTKIFLFQLNHNPQAFQLPLDRSHMMTRLLTSTCQPSQLTLSCLKLHLYHVRNVVTILLNKTLSNTIPLKYQPTHLSNTRKVPMVIPQGISVTVCCLKESHKPISNTD